jgi:hypothetical protein
MWKLRVEIHVRPYVKYRFQFADFHETHNYSVILHENLLYEILPNSIKKFGTYSYKLIYASV